MEEGCQSTKPLTHKLSGSSATEKRSFPNIVDHPPPPAFTPTKKVEELNAEPTSG